jgi:hypothetical protein
VAVAKGRLGEAGNDARLSAQVWSGRLDLAARCVKPARRVLDRHELRAGCLPVDFNPAKAGQHESVASVNDSAAIEFGEDLHRQGQVAPRFFHRCCFGNRSQKITAEPDQGFHRFIENASTSRNGIKALDPRRLESVLRGKLIEWREFRLLGDPDGTLALHVRVSPHGKDAGTRLANIASHQEEIA